MPFLYPAVFPEDEAKELLSSFSAAVKPTAAALLHDSWAVAGYVMGQAMPVGSGIPAFKMPPAGLKKLTTGSQDHARALAALQAAVDHSRQYGAGVQTMAAAAIDWQSILALAFSFINQLLPLL